MDDKDYDEIYNAYKNQVENQVLSESTHGTVPGKEQIIAVRKNDDGDIIAFKTENGRELDYVSALEEAKAGKLAHVDVFHKYGRDILRSEPDGVKENNFDNLDSF